MNSKAMTTELDYLARLLKGAPLAPSEAGMAPHHMSTYLRVQAARARRLGDDSATALDACAAIVAAGPIDAARLGAARRIEAELRIREGRDHGQI